ncbi:hypothetical protein ACRRTK_018570 [Alexandromys fortis]
MNPAVFLVILCLAVASAAESPDVTLEVKDQEATITNEKPKEEEYRRMIWDQFMKKIEVYNKKKGLENEDISLEMSVFDDLTDSEFTKLMNEVLLPMFDGEEKTQTQPVGDAVKFEYSPASGDVQDQVGEEQSRVMWEEFMKKIEQGNKEDSLEVDNVNPHVNVFDGLIPEEFKKETNELVFRMFEDEEKTQTEPADDFEDWSGSGDAIPVRDQDEEKYRRTLWEDEKKKIDEHNAEYGQDQTGIYASLNEFSYMVTELWIVNSVSSLYIFQVLVGFQCFICFFMKTYEEFRNVCCGNLMRAEEDLDCDKHEYKDLTKDNNVTPEKDQDEERHRRALWEENKKIIEKHNAEYEQGKTSYTMGLNQFSDMMAVSSAFTILRLAHALRADTESEDSYEKITVHQANLKVHSQPSSYKGIPYGSNQVQETHGGNCTQEQPIPREACTVPHRRQPVNCSSSATCSLVENPVPEGPTEVENMDMGPVQDISQDSTYDTQEVLRSEYGKHRPLLSQPGINDSSLHLSQEPRRHIWVQQRLKSGPQESSWYKCRDDDAE